MKVWLKVRCQAGQTLKTGAEPTAGTMTWLQPCDPATQICGPTTIRYPSPMEKAPQVQARSLTAASDLHTPARYTVNPAQHPGHAWGSHPKSHTPCMVFTVPAETKHHYGINVRWQWSTSFRTEGMPGRDSPQGLPLSLGGARGRESGAPGAWGKGILGPTSVWPPTWPLIGSLMAVGPSILSSLLSGLWPQGGPYLWPSPHPWRDPKAGREQQASSSVCLLGLREDRVSEKDFLFSNQLLPFLSPEKNAEK